MSPGGGDDADGAVTGGRSLRQSRTRRWRSWTAILALVAVLVAGWMLARPAADRYRLPNERGWGEPGPPGSGQGRRFARANIVEIRAGGVAVRVNRRASRNFAGFLDELAASGYAVRQNDTGGYNHRANVNNPDVLSEHSWGTAVDVNWTSNPNRRDCVLITDLPDGVRALARRWGLRWGGDFDCPKDSMHFEVIGTPEDAAKAVTEAVAIARAADE